MDNHRRETDKDPSPNDPRSTDPRDYQHLPQKMAVMAKSFPDGHRIPTHHHPRDQLIFATSGVMRVSTAHEAWVVPPDRALLLPAGLDHSVEMRGNVEMRTLYISPSGPAQTKVLGVNALLRELISALAEEPASIAGNQRAEAVAQLISLELERAEALPLNTPLPRDPRLQRLCLRLMENPALNGSLEQLADSTGASAKTLARLCGKELGMGFSEWRRRVRFATAIELLERGEAVKSVAERCGYASASAFTFAFKKEFAALPSTLRERS
ncbi:MAG: helix-turn-helix transcriptional regulator [Pseudomonadota bacterium]